MGTNYYLMTKDKRLVNKYFDGEYNTVDSPYFGYRIHLNKCSCGWKTLFERHPNAFVSFAELKDFFNNHNHLRIFNEYGTEYSWNEYEEKVIGHSINCLVEPIKFIAKPNVFDPERRMIVVMEDCEPEEAEIFTPFNHQEYSDKEKAAKKRYHINDWEMNIKYYSDPDYPVDWTDGSFS